MKNLRPEEENIIKKIRNLFRLEKETKGIKDKILKDIKNLFEEYYEPVRVNNFWSNNFTEYKNNSDKNGILSVEEYLDKIRPYLKDITNDHLKKSGTWKIQLTIAINFISSRDDNDQEPVMHSKSDNIEIIISDEVDEVIEKLFDSLKNRHQNNLGSMRGSDFVFDYIHLLYYKCHRINLNRGGSYIDSPDWIESKKATINPIKILCCHQLL